MTLVVLLWDVISIELRGHRSDWHRFVERRYKVVPVPVLEEMRRKCLVISGLALQMVIELERELGCDLDFARERYILAAPRGFGM